MGSNAVAAGLGLSGKKALVIGLANKHSLAFAITKVLQEHGCEVGVVSGPASFDRAKRSVDLLPLAPLFHLECDVTSSNDMESLRVASSSYAIDCLVHSVAFAPPESLTKPFLQTSSESYLMAMHVSSFSLINLLQKVHVQPGGSVVALSYLGACKAVPKYNCMGPAKAALESTCRGLALELGPNQVRVNAVSAGPVNTLSARGIPGISKMRQYVAEVSPLQRNATSEEIANATAFLCSPLSSGITGQTIYGKTLEILEVANILVFSGFRYELCCNG
jgi:enoyl-[acyl-carrier protein] reductase I